MFACLWAGCGGDGKVEMQEEGPRGKARAPQAADGEALAIGVGCHLLHVTAGKGIWGGWQEAENHCLVSLFSLESKQLGRLPGVKSP